MNVAILGEPAGWHVGRLIDALRAGGHEATVVRWEELAGEITGTADAAERFLPEAIDRADAIVVRGMPRGGLEEVIFRMDLLGRIARHGKPVVNSPRSLETSIDKYLSLARMAEAGVPVPRTIVAQEPTAIEEAWRGLGCDAVVKPLFGSRGQGIERLNSRDMLAPHIAAAAAADPPGAVCYLQEFVPHPGWDARVLLVGERVFAMRRVSNGDWRLNVSRGGRPEAFDPPDHWIELARRAAGAVEAEIAGVDLLPTPDGRAVVVEVNAVPGWRGLELATGANVAGAMVAYLERSMR
jgi:ribosomal protein S6--L-glutamate ligase